MWIQCTRDSAPVDYGTYPLGGGNETFFEKMVNPSFFQEAPLGVIKNLDSMMIFGPLRWNHRHLDAGALKRSMEESHLRDGKRPKDP